MFRACRNDDGISIRNLIFMTIDDTFSMAALDTEELIIDQKNL